MSKDVGGIIHSYATMAATAAAGLAQVPGSDNLVITPLQIKMIMEIAEAHGQHYSKGMAISTLSAATAGIAGRTVSQWAIGWIPGWGNAVNASTAFAITESIGWATDKILSS